MNTWYIVAAVIIIAVAAIALFALNQSAREEVPTVNVNPSEINAIGNYSELNIVSEINGDVMPSASDLNIGADVNDVTMTLPKEI